MLSPNTREIRSFARLLVGCLMLLGCAEATRIRDPNDPGFSGFGILVTGRHEQAAEAPSNGSIALVPMLQWDGNAELPGTGSTVVVHFVTSAGATVGSPVNLGNNTGDLPAAAFDGTNFLVVYQLIATAGTDLYGQFFNTSGAASSAAFPITTTHDSPIVWSVSYGGGVYLVTYSRTITGTLSALAKTVSPTGTLSAEIPIGDKGAMSTSAFGGTQFLVAFANQRTDVMGRFIQPNGSFGPSFTIDASPGASNGDMRAAYNGTNFLVAFADSATGTGWNVVTQAISSTGTPVGTPATIAGGTTAELPRGLLADGANFLVTWYGGEQIARATHGTFVNNDGAVIGGSVLFDGSTASVVAPIDSKLGSSFFALVNRRGTTWDVFGSLMTITP